MAEIALPGRLDGISIFLVGAKGTGMTALAEILVASGALVSGSDIGETFYTDRILSELGIDVAKGFAAANLPSETGFVIHSAAYSKETNPELREAFSRGIPVLSYPEALGQLSRRFDSSGICGVHGKTTTTALAGSIIAALGLPATTLAGSAFGGRSTRIGGERYFIAETCEYRRHFLHFSPRRIVLTSIEADHQDFFPTFNDIFSAFMDYLRRLPIGGILIYCADDSGASTAAEVLSAERPDIVFISYGRKASAPYRLESYEAGDGRALFRVSGIDATFELRVPGEHIALDAIAAMALSLSLLADFRAAKIDRDMPGVREIDVLRTAVSEFSGSKRRSEILGEARGILFVDDYGHHPTAIAKTIRGVREFWPARRLVVDFMSHTYSRTKALFSEFASCLDEADEVILHGIYPSAREPIDPSLGGEMLAQAVKMRAASARHNGQVSYFEKPLEAETFLEAKLGQGDLFLTIGAGDNWKLGAAIFERLKRGNISK
jgi:UDP-N-acetylmuramate--alanine ligase